MTYKVSFPDTSVTVTLEPAEAAAVIRAAAAHLADLANSRPKLEAQIREIRWFGDPVDDYEADLAEIRADQQALRAVLARLSGTS